MTKTTLARIAPDLALQPLWDRALADDGDRPAWLSARRGGLTATDMKIIARSRPATVREHLRKKATGTDAEFRGNKSTEWGNYREAQIIADLAGTEYLRCGLLIGHADNPRFMSTPDLVGVVFGGDVELVEVKTSAKDLNPAGPNFAETRYLEQILWQMFTTGAERVRLVVDRHDDDWSRWSSRPGVGWSFPDGSTLADYGPTLVSQDWYVFERADYAEQIEAMRVKAVDALGVLDQEMIGYVEEGPETFSDVEAREIGSAARQYAKAAQIEKAAKERKATEQAAILLLVKDRKAFSDRFDDVKVTYSPESVDPGSMIDDVDAALAAAPEVWERVQQTQAAAIAAADQWQAVLAQHQKQGEPTTTSAKMTITPPRGGVK